MPHIRRRHAEHIYDQVIAYSPIVGVFGHRQAGKTTFLEKVVASYYTLDDKKTLFSIEKDANEFLKNLKKKPAGIDECQFAEDLFPALKEMVRKNKAPGQIVLSGSVRFYSRQAIRESLTGRIVNIEILPMSLTELCEESRAIFPIKLIEKNIFSKDLESNLSKSILKDRNKHILTYIENGGLPGICFLRNEKIRSEKIRDQLLLILDRDLRLVYPTSVPYVQLLDFVRALTEQEGEPVQTTNLRKITRIAETTQKKLLAALEAVYIVRQISIEGDRKGICIYFEDQAEHLFLHEKKVDPQKAFEGLVFRNIRSSFQYETGLNFRIFQYRARPDIRIPFVISTKSGSIGILPILTEGPSSKDIRMAHHFLQRYSPATVLIVTQNQGTTKVIEPRILQVPAERLLFE